MRLMDQYKADKKRKYSAPTEELRRELIRAILAAHRKSAEYDHPSKAGTMREFMTLIHPAYGYFSQYKKTNQITLSDERERVMKKANRYYLNGDDSKRNRLSPREAKILLRAITQLGFDTGLYNVHRLSAMEEEGI